jgi:hypothetical protein
MTISDTTENAIMALIFNATTWTNYAQQAASSPETTIISALHSADPGEGGTMQTSEVTTGQYVGYLRASTTRDTTAGTGWTVAANAANPKAAINFPAGTGGTGVTANFFSLGHSGAAGSAQPILFSGGISPTIACGSGVTPSLSTATQITID